MRTTPATLSASLTLLSSSLATPPVQRAAIFADNAVSAAQTLNNVWYHAPKGQWQGLWWNSANVVTTLANLVRVRPSYNTTISGVFPEVFSNAYAANGHSWLNDFYDDEGWWALAWIDVFDTAGGDEYLSAAQDIFEDLKTGLDATCGGQWWSKEQKAINTINNELFLAVAASLANRVEGKSSYYRVYAENQARWLLDGKLQNADGLFVDGLNVADCSSEGPVWTYNQGVVLGALIELSKLTGNTSYLDTASTIAQAVMTSRDLNQDGILTERAELHAEDTTAAQFKGVFARNLARLYHATHDGDYVAYLQKNADMIWSHDRDEEGRLGADWQGPAQDMSAAAQSSALDCLVAAAMVS